MAYKYISALSLVAILFSGAEPLVQFSLRALSRLGMSVTTQGGSRRQYVTGSRRNISKYRFMLLNVYRFRET